MSRLKREGRKFSSGPLFYRQGAGNEAVLNSKPDKLFSGRSPHGGAGRAILHKGIGMKLQTAISALIVLSFFFAAGARDKDRETRLTFLDTLNRGRELMIVNPDSFRQSTAVKTLAAGGGAAGRTGGSEFLLAPHEAGVVPSQYRVQVLASTSRTQVKQEKRKLAAKIKCPLSISYEAPYYKLFAGNVPQRFEAQNILAQIKKLGYNDAWIVRTAVTKR